MALRVGRIPFLVCAPFFHDFLGRESRLADVEFVDGPPSAHCAGLKDGSIHVFDTSTFTVEGKNLDSYLADVEADENYEHETEVISDGYFHESEYRSAPYFDLQIDGINLLDTNFG